MYEDPVDTTTGITLTLVSGTGGSVIRSGDIGQEISCERYAAEMASERDRLRGKNLRRLKIAGRMIAPKYTSDADNYAGFAERQLAHYQEEVHRPQPDPTVAGIFIGLVSEKPIDLPTLERVDRALCATSDSQLQKSVIETANEQQSYLKKLFGEALSP